LAFLVFFNFLKTGQRQARKADFEPSGSTAFDGVFKNRLIFRFF
jgi:hypothetical protein